jgi:hypothetical protein
MYTSVIGLDCRRELSLALGDGSVMRPDVLSYKWTAPDNSLRVSLALFELEVHHRWTPGTAETATAYLDQLPSVVRVVSIRYFAPRSVERSVMNQLCVPAILGVFGRNEVGRVCAIKIQSFGNAPIDRRVFSNVFDVAPDDIVERYGAAAPWLPQHSALLMWASSWPSRALNRERQRRGAVEEGHQPRLRRCIHDLMGCFMGKCPAIPVDLVCELVQAMRGWSEDRAQANRVYLRSGNQRSPVVTQGRTARMELSLLDVGCWKTNFNMVRGVCAQRH